MLRLTPRYPVVLPIYLDEEVAVMTRTNWNCRLNTKDQYYTALVLSEFKSGLFFSLSNQSTYGCHFLSCHLYAKITYLS